MAVNDHLPWQLSHSYVTVRRLPLTLTDRVSPLAPHFGHFVMSSGSEATKSTMDRSIGVKQYGETLIHLGASAT